MIQFTCGHCGKSVRVNDAHAGKKGRCPSCRAIVPIPRTPATEGHENIAELAAAVRGQDDDSHAAVPPPPRVNEPEADEFELVDIRTSSAFETDTFPAIGANHSGQADQQASTPASQDQAGVKTVPLANLRAERASKRNLTIAVVIGLAVLAAGVALLVWVCLTQF